MEIENGGVIKGRRLEWFNHKSCPSWGYKNTQTDTFAVLHPKNETQGEYYPLYVVFHSAGHSIYSTVPCILNEGDHDIYHVPDDMYGLFLDCCINKETDWWWGGLDPREAPDADRLGTELQPVENRVLATVEYVKEKYHINKNRVYAAGNSMGGSGALGIALNHGDVFAAVIANVPAGVGHAVERSSLLSDKVCNLPDPPVAVDYSAQNDSWSAGHEKLYEGMKKRKYSLIGYWGPFGHENNYKKILDVNDLVLCFNPLNLKLNEAYPVFTQTSTDDSLPWPGNLKSTESGQVNAFFVWKNIADSKDAFEMNIRLLRKEEWKTKRILPDIAETFVTFRRIQKFNITSGEDIIYTYADQKGTVKPDSDGLITIKLKISQNDEILKLEKRM